MVSKSGKKEAIMMVGAKEMMTGVTGDKLNPKMACSSARKTEPNPDLTPLHTTLSAPTYTQLICMLLESVPLGYVGCGLDVWE